MGFSLGGGLIGGALGGVGGALFGGLAGNLVPQRPDSPNLPQAPTLNAPNLPQYPGFSPEEQQLLGQQQQYLQQVQALLSGYNQNPYMQAQNAVAQQELQNYQNALAGKNPPSQELEQQKQRDWQNLVEQMGQQGVKLIGDDPRSAFSSTSGNQAITDFNKRYQYLEQQYNLGQQQFGAQQNMARLGLNNQNFATLLGGYGQLGQQAAMVLDPYTQQRLGQFGVATQQATTNADIFNQNALNQYNRNYGQTMANYNNALMGYQTNMGLLGAGLGLAGQLGSSFIMRGMGNSGAGSLGMNRGGV